MKVVAWGVLGVIAFVVMAWGATQADKWSEAHRCLRSHNEVRHTLMNDLNYEICDERAGG